MLYWVLDGTNIGPNWPPPAIPILGASKSLLPGGKQIKENTCLMIFYDFYKKENNRKHP